MENDRRSCRRGSVARWIARLLHFLTRQFSWFLKRVSHPKPHDATAGKPEARAEGMLSASCGPEGPSKRGMDPVKDHTMLQKPQPRKDHQLALARLRLMPTAAATPAAAARPMPMTLRSPRCASPRRRAFDISSGRSGSRARFLAISSSTSLKGGGVKGMRLRP